jgi:hypothetical protein
MSNYARANTGGATHFGDKDALSTGDANKTIVGSQFDTEFNAVVTANATKYDSSDLASSAESQAETLNTVLITPLRLANWADARDGIVGDLNALNSAPAADRLLFYDFSGTEAAYMTVGTGLAITAQDIATDDAAIDHDALLNFVGDEHIIHTGVAVTAGTGLTGGGTIEATITLDVAGGLGLTANADDIQITDAAASTTNAIDINAGVFTIDLTALTSTDATSIVGADEFLLDQAGVQLSLAWQDFGVPTIDDSTTTPLSAVSLAFANQWINCNNAGAVSAVIPANASIAFPVGTVLAFHQRGAGQVTVSVTTDTLRAANGAKTRVQYATIFATKIAAAEWTISGDSAV